MSINILPCDVQSYLRSGVNITCPRQCVEELVLNSLDAQATCVAVRVNLNYFKIQVVDNGKGIPRDKLELVAERYATSKCHSLQDLENLQFYGYRGEALASIRDLSNVVELTSRAEFSTKTYCKVFTRGKSFEITESNVSRPSTGTTCTVHNFFYNFPIRRKKIQQTLDFEDIRIRLESIALIHPQVSFTLRNDIDGAKCLQTRRCNSIVTNFTHLFGSSRSMHLKSVKKTVNLVTVEGYVSIEGWHNKSLQFVYVNKRLILKTPIHKTINGIISKSLTSKFYGFKANSPITEASSPSKFSNRHGIFVLNISCPLNDYDVTFEPSKTYIEFNDWGSMIKCVQEAITDTLVREHLFENEIKPLYQTIADCINKCDETVHVQTVLDFSIENNVTSALISLPAKRVEANDVEERVNEDWLDHLSESYSSSPVISCSTRNCLANVSGDEKIIAVVKPNSKLLKLSADAAVTSLRDFINKVKRVDPNGQREKNHEESNCSDSEVNDILLKQPIGNSKPEEIGRRVIEVAQTRKISSLKRFVDKQKTADRLKSFSYEQVRPVVRFAADSHSQVFGDINGEKAHSLTQKKQFSSSSSLIQSFQDARLKEQKNDSACNEQRLIDGTTENCHLSQCCDCGEFEDYEFYDPLCLKCQADSGNQNVKRVCPEIETSPPKVRIPEDDTSFLQTSRSSDDIECNSNMTQLPLSVNTKMFLQNESEKSINSSVIAMDVGTNIPKGCQPLNEQVPDVRSTSCGNDTKEENVLNNSISFKSALSEYNRKKELKSTAHEYHNDIADCLNSSEFGKKSYINDLDSLEQKCREVYKSICQLLEDPKVVSKDFDSGKNTVEAIAENVNLNQVLSMQVVNRNNQLEIVDEQKKNSTDQTKNSTDQTSANEVKCLENVDETPTAVESANREADERKLNCVSPWFSKVDDEGNQIYVNETTGNSTFETPRVTLGGFQRPQSLFIGSTNVGSKGGKFANWKNSVSELNELLEDWDNPIVKSFQDICSAAVKEIPQAQIQVQNVIHSYKFTRSMLQSVKVLNQVDTKFIACLLMTKPPESEKKINLIVLFDQHAVHERIRLEQLHAGVESQLNSSEGRLERSPITPPFDVRLDSGKVRMIGAFLTSFVRWGFQLSVHPTDATSVRVHAVPTFLLEREASEIRRKRSPAVKSLTENIIQDIISLIQSTGSCNVSVPNTLRNILNSQACHGAVKFGDELDLCECDELVKLLCNCQLPFQCAHGRPSLVPLLDLNQLGHKQKIRTKPRYSRLQMSKKTS